MGISSAIVIVHWKNRTLSDPGFSQSVESLIWILEPALKSCREKWRTQTYPFDYAMLSEFPLTVPEIRLSRSSGCLFSLVVSLPDAQGRIAMNGRGYSRSLKYHG
jgi:hypothetical protein